ncbi:hypothetical protein SBA5_580049 [Candidatus Sulfotelmatomonas gaucii]|uniref:Uncharacterized protein n=1 Tax=Candidatus Sulfuritelmatomonas gaucii TaxID=2043161 RepID=A0A2N9LVD1_9BACT|nr:hypothetical protein SBA5_580049 [Candidatus Sulfotelmatomonas gaucii]
MTRAGLPTDIKETPIGNDTVECTRILLFIFGNFPSTHARS